MLVNDPRWETRTIVGVDGQANSPSIKVTVAHSQCSHGMNQRTRAFNARSQADQNKAYGN